MAFALTASAQTEQARVLVKFKPGKGLAVKSTLQAQGADFHHDFESIRTVAVTVPAAALNGLSQNPNIEFVEEDAKRYLFSQTTPYGIDSVQARDVWDTDRDGVVDAGAPDGSGVLVCVIDSGLNVNHDDFAGVNIVGGAPAGWDTDLCGHGTHVAGTIAAANNNLGVVGVSPGAADLYIFQVFGNADCSWSYASDLVDAANHCASVGADIISMSLGGSFSSRTEENAFAALDSQGILNIAAAGNDGNTRKSYPASYDSVMSVAATDSTNTLASFSQRNDQVEISAPGVAVLSTVPWSDDNTITVGGTTASGSHIDLAGRGNASGALADGGTCETVGSWSGNIVLCERGNISFNDKVVNAVAGGATAVVIYNNAPGGFAGTLGDGNSSSTIAIGISQEDGQALVANHLGGSATVSSNFSSPGSGYEAWDGTSMATPHVSGVAAVLMSAGNYTNQEVRDAMNSTALDLGAPGRDNDYGYGLVQTADALAALEGNGGGDPPAGYSLSASGYKSKGKNVVDLSWSGNNGSVDIYRDGSLIASGVSGSAYTDNTGTKGGATFTYQVCDAGSSTCSNSATVNF